MMLGYDFCKSDAYHFGLYIKFVIPTGTKIDQCFLQNVLTPVIGNGRHFELGVGFSAHTNFLVCDSSSFGIFADGYIDGMFGACQTRTYDLPGMPMSRYALAFNVENDGEGDYTVNSNTIAAIGDVNLNQGNVTATRGEFMLDLIWSCCNWELGIGYALAAQSREQMACPPCGGTASVNGQYGFVGQAYQNSFGVGTILPASGTANPTVDNGVVSTFAAAGVPNTSFSVPVNFYNLGNTNNVAEMDDDANAAYTYGTPTEADGSNLAEVGVFTSNCSGLMGRQVLNRVFGHIDYVWRDCSWQPELGILGSIGFAPTSSVTAAYWDVGARCGFAF
jgi:hypothetical protein